MKSSPSIATRLGLDISDKRQHLPVQSSKTKKLPMSLFHPTSLSGKYTSHTSFNLLIITAVWLSSLKFFFTKFLISFSFPFLSKDKEHKSTKPSKEDHARPGKRYSSRLNDVDSMSLKSDHSARQLGQGLRRSPRKHAKQSENMSKRLVCPVQVLVSLSFYYAYSLLKLMKDKY